MKRKLIVERGLPGSGKSYRAQEHKREFERHYTSALILSTDDYFIRPDGRYGWSGRELPHAHGWTFERAHNVLTGAHPFADEIGLVIIDNTNIKRLHFELYLQLAQQCDWDTQVETVGAMPASKQECIAYFERCTHNVPLETILRMNEEWEP